MSMNRIPPEGTLLKRDMYLAGSTGVTVLGIYMGCFARKPTSHVVIWFWGSLGPHDTFTRRYDERTLMLFSRA